MAKQIFLCGDVVGRRKLDCGVLMDFLFDKREKAECLWPSWVYELFTALIQTFSSGLQCVFFNWRVGIVACEFASYNKVACGSNKMFCNVILVSSSVPEPKWKQMTLSTVGIKIVMKFFYKLLFLVPP